MNKLNKWNQFLFCGLLISLNSSQSLIDLFGSLIVGTLLYYSFTTKINSLKVIPKYLNIALIAMFASVILSYFFGAPDFTDTKIKGTLEFRWAIIFLCSIALFFQTTWEKQNLKNLLYCFSFITLTNLIYYFISGNERAGGLFHNPMFFAQNLGPLLLLLTNVCFYLLNKDDKDKKSILITFLTLIAGLTLLLLTQTRGVWLGFAFAIFLNLIFLRNKIALKAAITLVLSGLIILTFSPTMRDRITMQGKDNGYSKAVRPIIWKGNLELFSNHPTVGVGHNINNLLFFDTLTESEKSVVNAEPGLNKAHAHNQYIQVLAGTGFIGFLAYLSFLTFVLIYAFRAIQLSQKTSFEFFLSTGLLAGLICFLVAGATECNFSISKTRSLFLILAAASIAIVIKRQKRYKS